MEDLDIKEVNGIPVPTYDQYKRLSREYLENFARIPVCKKVLGYHKENKSIWFYFVGGGYSREVYQSFIEELLERISK